MVMWARVIFSLWVGTFLAQRRRPSLRRLRVSYASHPTRCLIFKQTARMIPERATRLHAAMSSHRILYAGDDVTLPGLLKDALHGHDCFVVRSPVETTRTLI